MNPTAAHVNTASPFVEHGSRNDVASGERKRRYSSEMAIDYTTTHYNKLSVLRARLPRSPDTMTSLISDRSSTTLLLKPTPLARWITIPAVLQALYMNR